MHNTVLTYGVLSFLVVAIDGRYSSNSMNKWAADILDLAESGVKGVLCPNATAVNTTAEKTL